jgi:hypothetical protein
MVLAAALKTGAQSELTPQPSAMALVMAVWMLEKALLLHACKMLSVTLSGTAPETSRSVCGSTALPCRH